MILKDIFELLTESFEFEPAYAGISNMKPRSLIDLPNIIFHKGRTDSDDGHKVRNAAQSNAIPTSHETSNELANSQYHYHHGKAAHLHPDGKCPYKVTSASIIDLFISFGGTALTVSKSTSNGFTYSFEAMIEYKPGKFFAVELTGVDGAFYLAGDGKKEHIENFFGTCLNPEYIVRKNSPWSGTVGGFDYIVAEEYFKELVERYCSLEGSSDEYINAEQLIAIGWNKDVVTRDMVKELNRMLEDYGITDINSIRHFIAQASHESDDWYKTGYGDGLIEIGSNEYLQGQKYWPYIGAGYIHLTWEYNYQKFCDYLREEKGIDDPLIMSEGPNRIASTYAWESAAYFWSVFTKANDVASHPDVHPDKLSEIVNKYDKASFPVREDIYYNKVVPNIK